MAVPEASVDEHDGPPRAEYEVWFARHVGRVRGGAEAEGTEHVGYSPLWASVPALHAGHAFGSLLGIQGIHRSEPIIVTWSVHG